MVRVKAKLLPCILALFFIICIMNDKSPNEGGIWVEKVAAMDANFRTV